MNDNMIASLKLIYKPLIMYYGDWELCDGLDKISLEKNGKSLFMEFLNRYYYMPLRVIFKEESFVETFNFAIESKTIDNVRTLYFSKKAFLRNLISNADDVVLNGGEDVYKDIKRAIRIRKDVYRDVLKNKEDSEYYTEVLEEYNNSEVEVTFFEFVSLCRKKFTKLLSGYNAVIDLFDKSLNVDKFIKCFDPNQLYLFTAYSLLKNSENNYEKFGRVEYNLNDIENYKSIVDEIRESDSFYNSHIIVEKNKVYTIDDFFKEYNEFIGKINKG